MNRIATWKAAAAVTLVASVALGLAGCSSDKPVTTSASTTAAPGAGGGAANGGGKQATPPADPKCAALNKFDVAVYYALNVKNATPEQQQNLENKMKDSANALKTAVPEIATSVDARVVVATKKLHGQQPAANENDADTKAQKDLGDWGTKNCQKPGAAAKKPATPTSTAAASTTTTAKK